MAMMHQAGLQLLCALVVWSVVSGSAVAAASLPEGLESKPLLEQLLARKAFLAEHMRSEEWRQYTQQQWDVRSSPFHQQGVLIIAGGRDMFANAAITLRVLRHHLHSTVPVEIIHYGPKELPPPELLTYIASFNGTEDENNSHDSTGDAAVRGPVFMTDALAAAPPDKVAAVHRQLPEGIKSFPAKVYALTHATRFRKVLLLDADSMPLVDPNLLFKVPLFQLTGSMFWPDLWWNAWVNDTIYSLVGDMKEAPWTGNKHHRLVDSGQILFDRVRHAEVLEYLWLLNSHHEWVYKHMHGDKDTFLLAFSMAGKLDMLTQVPCFARDAMRDVPGHEHRYHHLGLVGSMPPAMLGAAIRAAAAARDSDQHHNSTNPVGSSKKVRALPPSPPDISTEDSNGDSNGSRPVDGTRHLQGCGSQGLVGCPQDSTQAMALLLARRLLGAGLDQLATVDSSSSSSNTGSWRQRGSSRQMLQPGSEDDVGASSGGAAAANEDVEEAEEAEDDLGGTAAAMTGALQSCSSGSLTPCSSSSSAAAVSAERCAALRYVGLPVFFHRASFNSKFFPDCLRADKIKTGYCEVEWLSVPLSNHQAGHALQPNIYAFNDDQIDTTFYQQHCSANASLNTRDPSTPPITTTPRRLAAEGPSTSGGAAIGAVPQSTSSSAVTSPWMRGGGHRWRRPVFEQYGLPPEHSCALLPVSEDVLPIPVMRVGEVFPYMDAVLRASYEAFQEVREIAGVKV